MKKILTVLICFFLGCLGAYLFILFQNRKETTKIISFLPEKITPTKTAFSLENSPSEALRAYISTISGEILWQSRTASEPALLSNKDLIIQQGERLIASNSGSITINFDLAGEISLFSNTEVDLVQTLPVNLVFKQTKGTVDYESESNTFAVLVGRLLVSFSNASATISYEETTGVIRIKVNRGQTVAAYNNQNFISQKITLLENESFIFYNDKREGEKSSL